MDNRFDEVIGSGGQRRDTSLQVDGDLLRRIGFQAAMSLETEVEAPVEYSVTTAFLECWRNERCSPEILPYEVDGVKKMKQLVDRPSLVDDSYSVSLRLSLIIDSSFFH
jgi:hypothetical protein